jgi:glycine/D-amino acid oxidase-like deaminating enzyme
MAHYSRLAAEVGPETVGLQDGGALFWVAPEDAGGRAELRRRVGNLRAWNYPATSLNVAEMRALEPRTRFPEGAEGLFAPADRWVDAPRLVRFYIDGAIRHGAEMRLQCPATGFTRSITGAISTVETPQGRIATRLLVLAAGVETPALAALAAGDPTAAARCPVRREPGLLVETATLPAPTPAHRILYPPDHAGLHLRPTPTGGLLLGADDTDAAVQKTGQNAADFAAAAADLWRRAASALPDLDAYTTHLDTRICVRPVPQDSLPIVGPLPNVPGVYVAATHSGITLGPLLAHLLTEEIVVGRPPADLIRYRPERFGA